MTRYEVRGFYDPNGNELAFHTWNDGVVSRDMEIAATRSRADILRVEWRRAGGDWEVAP